MSERWFTEEELRELSRPTMDRAIEALDAGDVETARGLCEAMKHEWLMLHDLYAAGTAGLLTFIKNELGEDAIARAHEESMAGHWQSTVEKGAEIDRRRGDGLLAGTWRGRPPRGGGGAPRGVTSH